MREALENLCDAIADTEMHGDGAHDEDCFVCKAHQAGRATLSTKQEGEAGKVSRLIAAGPTRQHHLNAMIRLIQRYSNHAAWLTAADRAAITKAEFANRSGSDSLSNVPERRRNMSIVERLSDLALEADANAGECYALGDTEAGAEYTADSRSLREAATEIKRLRATKQEGEESTGACRHCPAMFRTRAEMEEHERECGAGAAPFDALEKAATVADVVAARERAMAQSYVRSKYIYAEHATAAKACTEVAKAIRALKQEGLVAGAEQEAKDVD